MRTQDYMDTFHATMSSNVGQIVPLSILVGIWNAPLIAIVLVFKTLYIWQKRIDQRRQIATQEVRSLRDMGISRQDATQEAAKPFWIR